MGVRVALDLFPAVVTLPDGTEVRPARAIVAEDELLVYIVANGKPTLFHRSAFVSAAGGRIRGYTVTTDAGVVAAEIDRNGCGCSNPLKRYNPWPSERKMLVPL